MRPTFEVADVFHRHGEAYIRARGGKIGRVERRVMSAIQLCRTAALGGHFETCEACGFARPAYNSCRNRHCTKCQGAAQIQWIERRQSDLLPVPYFHVVFTLPAPIADVAFHNKAVIYAILLKTAAATLQVIAADPKHLGAEIGLVAVLHTWGQNLHHHPHAHCVVPGGGLSLDGQRWVRCRRTFFLPVKVLARLYRRLFLKQLAAAFAAGQITLTGELASLGADGAFVAALAAWRRIDWVVYAKPPFGGPKQVLNYLGRYTHRVAIANSRIVALDDDTVSFRWRDYRAQGQTKIMRVTAIDFIRRFLQHTLPDGFQRIRHYGLLANARRVEKLALCRRLLAACTPEPATPTDPAPVDTESRRLKDAPTSSVPHLCPCCGGRLAISSASPTYTCTPLRRAWDTS